MEKPHVGIESCNYAGLFHHGVEHAVGVIQQAVKLVLGRLPGPALKSIPIRHDKTQRVEVGPSSRAFHPHDGSPLILQRSVERAEFAFSCFQPLSIYENIRFFFGPGMSQFFEKVNLTGKLFSNPLLG